MERMEFDAPQERVVKGRYGEVLVLVNGRKEKVEPTATDGGADAVAREVWAYDALRLATDGGTSPSSLLAAAKAAREREVDARDTSDEVRCCLIGGRRTWLSRDERAALMNSARIAAEQGARSFTLWVGGEPHAMTPAEAVDALSKIEIYAQACFDATARHKAAIAGMHTVEEVAAYDIKEGYPTPVVIHNS